jgi:hypothetical protein
MNINISIIVASIIFSVNIYTQEFNTLINDKKTDKPMLIGSTTLEAFSDTSFSWWWNSSYNMYEVDAETAGELKEKLEDINIKIVSGTWCSDSRRELPRLFKILDSIQYPTESVVIISVNRDKVGLEDEVEGLQIDFVPTIIFSKENKELGRIIEMPFETLEKDMLEILTDNIDE